MIGDIQSRINIRGKFTGQWGPLPNHYAEPVLGAMISVSGTQVTVEESEPNAFSSLHDYADGEVIIMNALPGVWRGNPRESGGTCCASGLAVEYAPLLRSCAVKQSSPKLRLVAVRPLIKNHNTLVYIVFLVLSDSSIKWRCPLKRQVSE